ncbi:voltage-gated ion channel [Sarcoptes scabiei]|nr:voltage-gated ion channel [Sarcoptes scabiei]
MNSTSQVRLVNSISGFDLENGDYIEFETFDSNDDPPNRFTIDSSSSGDIDREHRNTKIGTFIIGDDDGVIEDQISSVSPFSNSLCLTESGISEDFHGGCIDRNKTPLIMDSDLLSNGSSLQLPSSPEVQKLIKNAQSKLHHSHQSRMLFVENRIPSIDEMMPRFNTDPNRFESHPSSREFSLAAFLQIFIAVMTAASGNFAAGLILDRSKSWNVYHYTPELYYLVPILLSLKGNLEMTMVARLSTLAHMGSLRTFTNILRILFYNICLVQTQAIIVSILASLVTFVAIAMEEQSSLASSSSTSTSASIAGSIMIETSNQINLTDQTFLFDESNIYRRKLYLVFACSLATANLACLLSTILMILITVALHHMDMNPDNFVTALAASFGDIITSFFVGIIGEIIYDRIVYLPSPEIPLRNGIKYFEELQSPTFAIIVIVFFLLILPLMTYFTCQYESTRKILIGFSTWIPILISMLIAFCSGLFLRFGAVEFNFMSLFQPMINGIGGNLAAISTSRYSTELHITAAADNHLVNRENSNPIKKILNKNFNLVLKNTFDSFFVWRDSRNQLIVMFVVMSIIVHLFYGILAPMIHASDEHEITVLFYFFYLPATVLQVLILLILTRFFVDIVWWLHYDPDTSALPILTAMGDILGTILLYLVFILLRSLGDVSSNPPIINQMNETYHSFGLDNVPISDRSPILLPRIVTENLRIELSKRATDSTLPMSTIDYSTTPSLLASKLTTINLSSIVDNLTTYSFINYIKSNE